MVQRQDRSAWCVVRRQHSGTDRLARSARSGRCRAALRGLRPLGAPRGAWGSDPGVLPDNVGRGEPRAGPRCARTRCRDGGGGSRAAGVVRAPQACRRRRRDPCRCRRARARRQRRPARRCRTSGVIRRPGVDGVGLSRCGSIRPTQPDGEQRDRDPACGQLVRRRHGGRSDRPVHVHVQSPARDHRRLEPRRAVRCVPLPHRGRPASLATGRRAAPRPCHMARATPC